MIKKTKTRKITGKIKYVLGHMTVKCKNVKDKNKA